MEKKYKSVEKRNEIFASRTVTRIWKECASVNNPYIATSARCFGYDLIDLMQKRTFVDVLFLLFKGELPTSDQAEILESLMIALINPGPRHPAARAAMQAGVGKTNPVHILPISLSIMGGSHNGAGCIEEGMRFFRKYANSDSGDLLIEKEILSSQEEDKHPFPGFGNRFGGIDELAGQIAEYLNALPGSGKALSWGCDFAKALQPHGIGWLSTGIAAAVFADLGFHPKAGAGLLQIISAPGLLAHGLEMVSKPITAMPFPSDENYIIEK